MPEHADNCPDQIKPSEAAKIYILPNLMTAGNLFCGFMAVIRCIQAKFVSEVPVSDELFFVKQTQTPEMLYEQAVWFILAGVIFDSLDGRLARLGGRESLFGKEFDSIADTVSFGMAPALMVFFLILSPTASFPFYRNIGWIVSFIYLLCVAVRLARFNVLTHPLIEKSSPETQSETFAGLPSPAAAGMIASLVLVMNRIELQGWLIFLPALLLLIATLMISDISYPNFKNIGWSTELTFKPFICLLVVLVFIYLLRSIAIAIIFLIYIFYGLLLHFHLLGKKIICEPASEQAVNKK